MATIYYEITDGVPNFTAKIDPAVRPDNIHNSPGIYYFSSVPDGNYAITIIDAWGCEVVFPVEVNCET
jgi:hypothetical protein